MDSVWMEKYRPRSLDEVIGQPQAVSRLRSLLTGGSLPHLLLVGPPGSGKTTCALITANMALGGMTVGNFLEICGSDLTRTREVEKKSDDDDVKVVKRKESSPLWRIKEFATTTSIDGVSFRVAFIDEVDTLSKDVQEALRRTIEMYSGNCAFILCCNNPSRIIDPVRSRCNAVHFNPIPDDVLSARISEIAIAEGVRLKSGTANGIAVASKGDIRKAMGMLQAAASEGEEVSLDMVFQLTETPASMTVEGMIRAAMTGSFMKARDSLDTLIIDYGMDGREVMDEIHKQALSLGLNDLDAVRLMDKVGDTDMRVAQCGTGGQAISLQRIQIESLLAYIMMTCRKRRTLYDGARR